MAQLLIVAGALQAAGALHEGEAAEAEGKSAQRMQEYNAQVSEMEAKAARQKARFDQQRQAEAGERTKSAQIAKLGAAGGLGSPVAGDLAAEQAAELELENLMIGYEGDITAKRLEQQAELDRMQGKIYMKKGKNLKTASYAKAGGSLLQGFGSAGGGKSVGSGGLSHPSWG